VCGWVVCLQCEQIYSLERMPPFSIFSESGIIGGVNLSCVRLLRVLEFENLLFGLGICHLYYKIINSQKKEVQKKPDSG